MRLPAVMPVSRWLPIENQCVCVGGEISVKWENAVLGRKIVLGFGIIHLTKFLTR